VQCDLEIQEELNSDLLERAMRGDETRLVQLIEELDADVTATDSFGQTVLHLTAKYGNLDCLNRFLNCLDQRDKAQVPAVRERKYIVARNSFGQTPVLVAALEGRDDCLEVLLGFGAPVDDVDHHGRTALHLAALHRHPKCLQVLLRYGANLELADSWRDNRALHLAAWGGSAECLGLVAERGARIDAANRDGLTPLHFAASVGDPVCVAILVKLGADAGVRALDGRSALEMAKHDNCRKLLSQEQAKLIKHKQHH